MSMHSQRSLQLLAIISAALWTGSALAQASDDNSGNASQQPGQGATGSANNSPQGQSGTAVGGNPPQTTTSTTETMRTPYGVPGPGFDPDRGLSSSSRAPEDDTFDMPGAGSTPTVRGTGEGILATEQKRAGSVPQYHLVRRGDTLWDLCGYYYDNPWAWPRVWSYNPQIENPHWIYPGDRVRMRVSGAASELGSQLLPATTASSTSQAFAMHRAAVPSGTVFLRDRGYVANEPKDVWGQVVGSPEDHMLLAEGDDVYLEIKGEHEVRAGQQLSIFLPMRKPETNKSLGYIVKFHGTARVVSYNTKTHIARAQVVEALDVIERGALIGTVGRSFQVVPPTRNTAEVWGEVVANLEPTAIIGQSQLVFINKGEADGLHAGNRLFVVDQGDRWRQSIKGSGKLMANRVHYEVYGAEIDSAPDTTKGKQFPREVTGELLVLRTQEHSAACLVTSSEYELEAGTKVVARRGY